MLCPPSSVMSRSFNQLERMEKTLESVRSNFNTVRTGRASPSLLDRIEVRGSLEPNNNRVSLELLDYAVQEGSCVACTDLG